ncbi:uncharacterized protein ACMZJ9_004598 [Mantella aurantiaca]
MDGGNKGYGSWGQARDHQGRPFGEHGSQWQEYEFQEPLVNVGGPGSSFSQGYGMPPDLLSIPERTLYHSKFEVSESRTSGWQSERGNSLWDRPGRPYKGFQRPFDRSNTRGMDDHFSRKKRKRIFTAIQPTPVKSEKSDTTNTPYKQGKPPPSAAQAKDVNDMTKQSSKTEEAVAAPGKMDPTEGQSVSYTPSTTFTCKLCKFETPDEIEISKHFASSQHVEVIKHLYIFLPKQRVDFIQDYLNFERNKVYQERNRQKLQPRKDSFKGIGQEHFFHRVDAAHCLACDTLIHNIPELLIEHTKSESHVQKCKMSFKEIKSNCLAMAKAILQDKYVLELLKVYNKGQNPFKDTVHLPSGHEVLVAEEDDYVPLAEDVADADSDENEDSSLNALIGSDSEVKERSDSNSDKVLISHDTDDEEAAEAP